MTPFQQLLHVKKRLQADRAKIVELSEQMIRYGGSYREVARHLEVVENDLVDAIDEIGKARQVERRIRMEGR